MLYQRPFVAENPAFDTAPPCKTHVEPLKRQQSLYKPLQGSRGLEIVMLDLLTISAVLDPGYALLALPVA